MVRVALYKAPGRFFDKLIKLWTCPWSDKFNGSWRDAYSHCELVFSDGLWFSADARTGKVRFAKIIEDPLKWDFTEVRLDTFAENKVRRWCERQEGKGYDYLGVFLAAGLYLGIEDPDCWFCSEICTAALQQVGKLKGVKGYTVSPVDLGRLLKGNIEC